MLPTVPELPGFNFILGAFLLAEQQHDDALEKKGKRIEVEEMLLLIQYWLPRVKARAIEK